jgi:hypothetical protein
VDDPQETFDSEFGCAHVLIEDFNGLHQGLVACIAAIRSFKAIAQSRRVLFDNANGISDSRAGFLKLGRDRAPGWAQRGECGHARNICLGGEVVYRALAGMGLSPAHE